MLKTVGALCVILTCGAFSLQAVNRKRITRRAVGELSALLSELARSIGFALEPLPAVIRRLTEDSTPPAAEFLLLLTDGLNQSDGQPLSLLWQSSLGKFAEEKQLPQEAVQILQAVGSRLGQTDFETERKRLLDAADELKILSQNLESGAAGAEKTVKTLGVLLGIFIVIILI